MEDSCKRDTFSKLWRRFSGTAAIRRMFLFVFLLVEFLLKRGGTGLPPACSLPERPGTGLTVPGVVTGVSAVTSCLPQAGHILCCAVRRERVPPEHSVCLLVSRTEERSGAAPGRGIRGTFLVETLVVRRGLSPDLLAGGRTELGGQDTDAVL